MWLVGVATGCPVRMYIDFLILLIPTPLASVLFCSSIPTFCSFLCFSFFNIILPVCDYLNNIENNVKLVHILLKQFGFGALVYNKYNYHRVRRLYK